MNRVLVVCADPRFRRVARRVFEAGGYNVVGEDDDGIDALVLLQSNAHAIDILSIIDFLDPPLDARELRRIVRASYPHIQVWGPNLPGPDD